MVVGFRRLRGGEGRVHLHGRALWANRYAAFLVHAHTHTHTHTRARARARGENHRLSNHGEGSVCVRVCVCVCLQAPASGLLRPLLYRNLAMQQQPGSPGTGTAYNTAGSGGSTQGTTQPMIPAVWGGGPPSAAGDTHTHIHTHTHTGHYTAHGEGGHLVLQVTHTHPPTHTHTHSHTHTHTCL